MAFVKNYFEKYVKTQLQSAYFLPMLIKLLNFYVLK